MEGVPGTAQPYHASRGRSTAPVAGTIGVQEEHTMSGFADYEQYDALGLADLVRRRKEVTPTISSMPRSNASKRAIRRSTP